MRRIKCKECREWNKDKSKCDLNYNVHAPGKKRNCIHFEQRKVQESNIPVFRVPWMSRWEQRKLRLRAEHDRKKQQELQNLMDQQKLLETPIDVRPEPEMKIVTKKPAHIKKPNFFKKLLRQKIF